MLGTFWEQLEADATAWLAGSTCARATSAFAVSVLVVLLFGNPIIRWLTRFREPNRSDSPRLDQLHAHKSGTPTMGGVLIFCGLAAGLFFLGDLSNRLLQLAVYLCGALALIGVVDDWIKVRTLRRGLRPRTKLLAQFVVSTLVAAALYQLQQESSLVSGLWVPGSSRWVELGIWWMPLAVLVLVGSANAVNLTDGLDGLAAGCLAIAFAALTVLCIVIGSVGAESTTALAGSSQVISLPPITHARELAVVAATACGSVIGFLWYNRQPARVFMGDAGSLPLGGLLGLIALAAGMELALVVIGAVFVAEAASVILQVGSYKLRRKRVFRCAPLHHHFQFSGWSERTTVTRFWLAGGVAAALGLMLGISAIVLDRPGPQGIPVSSEESLPSLQHTASAGRLGRAER
jgi:phospho-N-acetylmuramoyl-pentapeptide-transferase